MSRDLPADLWKRLTSTVGLVCTNVDGTVNVMSAEWSCFVNKQPLYAAVALGPRCVTGGRVEEAGEFSVTLCAEDQAALADFAGSFSRADIDKTGSDLVGLGAPEATGTPWVTGGVVAVECLLRQVVPLPSHTLYIGEVVAAHLPDGPVRPLVKHGAMYALGEPVERTQIVAAAEVRPGGTLRVAATGPGGAGAREWRVTLLDADGSPTPLGTYPSALYDDLLVDVPLPAGQDAGALSGHRVVVERDGAKPGTARVAGAGRGAAPVAGAGPGTAPVTEAGRGAAPVTEAGPNTAPVTEAGPNTAPATEAGPNTAPVTEGDPGAPPRPGGRPVTACPGLPESPLRIAVVQTAARPLDIAGNVRIAAGRAGHAARRGARVVVLPELHLCSYDLRRLARDDGAAAVRADRSGQVTDRRMEPLVRVAAHHRVTVLLGAAVRRPGGPLTNSLLAVEPDGTVSVPYDKRHLWHDEEAALFSPGSRASTLSVDGWRLGLGVCYDMSFPEHARAAALTGAHAVLYPAAYASGTEHRAAVYLRARALENTVYTVFANPLGGPAHRPCAGSSAVYGPDGATVADAPAGEDTTLVADLDPKALAAVRRHLRMLAELRTAAR
ncbi:nitrilase-related carbon-nitrogen hydrolase [Streptomyces sp. NPDC006186]|uniref:nitrilase-related carbon-nitrogen hydrolase n=1 Tax=Streptomyces sp. NPDC006186 TaxID=3155248 RepID=UPI0033A98D4A